MDPVASPGRSTSIGTDPGFGIYLHWPFCVSKCPYCDFNSHVSDNVDHDRWRACLVAELRHYAGLTEGRTVTSIFFGGGTPSLMQPATIALAVDTISLLWPVAADIEISAEANPGSVDQAVFEGFALAGINRVSIGVQSFDEEALRFLGRKHRAGEARAAIELAARLFPRFSFDLIYARPGQTIASWQAELDEALQYGPRHLSAYQLTIEQGTQFETLHRQGLIPLPEDDLSADLYRATGERLAAAGLSDYEVSNYAAPGHESRHNLTYWRYGDYVGVGPGAHGRLTIDGAKYATRAHRAPEKWLELVEANGHGAHPMEQIGDRERVKEMLLMGLRLADPIRIDRIADDTGRSFHDWVEPARLAKLVQAGYLSLPEQGVASTAQGRLRLNSVLGYLFPADGR